MDRSIAAALLSNLMERLTGETLAGRLTSLEREAIGVALNALGSPLTAPSSDTVLQDTAQKVAQNVAAEANDATVTRLVESIKPVTSPASETAAPTATTTTSAPPTVVKAPIPATPATPATTSQVTSSASPASPETPAATGSTPPPSPVVPSNAPATGLASPPPKVVTPVAPEQVGNVAVRPSTVTPAQPTALKPPDGALSANKARHVRPAPLELSNTLTALRNVGPLTLPGASEHRASKRIELVLDALNQSAPSQPDVMLCLDFGTAMSKAFAMTSAGEHLDLELGRAAGESGYAVPSSVFIGDDRRVYFGHEALRVSENMNERGRRRLDSIKGSLSLRNGEDLDGAGCQLGPDLNPTGVHLSEGDLLRIYLAYLTFVTNQALAQFTVQGRPVDRYVQRRFARPCWPDPAQVTWADTVMRRMMAEAQILADTFAGRFQGGIPVQELRDALNQLKGLNRLPNHLVLDSVPEPVAVAAAAMTEGENFRDAFMVVDAGAGTTDFGLFIVTRRPNEEIPRVHQLPSSILGVMMAGDRVDNLLRAYIMRKEHVDLEDPSGKIIVADLVRRMRPLKEVLFKTGQLEYALVDGTTGQVTVTDFLANQSVQKFGADIEAGFRRSLEMADDTWLQWLSSDGVRLHVVLTGGSSQLPMIQSLARGPIEIRGRKIMRQLVDTPPSWMRDAADELVAVYPQLAVAIGGAADELPQTVMAPNVFGGGHRSSFG